MGFDQQRRELPALPLAAADRERAQRVAVIALTPRDQEAALRLAALDEILPRQLQRRLDRLRSAADEEDVAEAVRRVRDQVVGKLFGHLRGEEAGMGIGELVELGVHRRDDIGMRMARDRTPRRRRRRRYIPCPSRRGW